MKSRPAVKILIPYLAGIILADRFNLSVINLWILSAVLMIAVFAAYKRRWLSTSSALLFLSFLFVGFLRYEVAMIPPHGIQNILYQQVKVRGTVVSSEKARRGGSSLILKGAATSIDDPSATMTGKISIRSWDEIFPQKYGDVVELEGRFTRPSLPRNPGIFNYRQYLERQGIFATMTVEAVSEVQTVGAGGNPFLRWIKGLRGRIETIIDDTMPPESAPTLKAITLGDRSALDDETYEAFLRTGTSHIFAVSGLHIGIIAGWTFLLFNWIRKLAGLKSKAIAYILAIPVVIVYASMAGFRTSVIRASILVILALIAIIYNRDVDIFNSLAIAAMCILIFRPGAFFEAGFQLSFGAVASIAYLMQHWDRWFARVRGNKWYLEWLYRVLQSIAVSLSAQIGAMLIIAHTFHRISIVGVFVNPNIIPLVALIVPMGFVSYFAGMIYLPLAGILGYVNHLLVSILNSIVFYYAEFHYAQVPVMGFSFWHIAVFSAVIVFIANLPMLMRNKRRLILASAGVLAILVWTAALSYDGRVLKVTCLDVGQGDSIFVDLPNGDNILVDGGSYRDRFDTGKRVISPFLEYEGVNSLDLMVSTHPHNDHAGGLTYVVDNFRINRAITGNYGLTTPTFEELRDRFDKRGVEYEDAQVGDVLTDGSLRVEVIGPVEPDLLGSEDTRMNNNSVVLRVTYKGVSFLLTGDISDEAERSLIGSADDIRATVLKVPHQGSKTSSSWEFLRAVQPTIGVVSVGRRNYYGHPSPMIMGRYRWLGIKTYRTDRKGAVMVVTDGRRGWIRTMF